MTSHTGTPPAPPHLPAESKAMTGVEAKLQLASTVHPRRFVALVLGSVAILTAIGIAVVVLVGRSGAATFRPGSPEARVQIYLRALQDGRVDRAYAMTNLGVSRAEYHTRFDQWSEQSHRVTLTHSYVHAGTATVTVDVSTFTGSPLGASDSTSTTTFTLTRERSGWNITGPAYLPY